MQCRHTFFPILSFLFIQACTENSFSSVKVLDEEHYSVSKELVGNNRYEEIYRTAEDSLNNWIANDIEFFENSPNGKQIKLDSLICFDLKGKRIIGALLNFYNGYEKGKYTEGITYFLGENIDGRWYFWTGAYVVIPREICPHQDPRKPLTYMQMHEQAMNNVFGAYLNGGKVNNDWFLNEFEGPGWGKFENRYNNNWPLRGKRIDDRDSFFKFLHKQQSEKRWVRKTLADSTLKANS